MTALDDLENLTRCPNCGEDITAHPDNDCVLNLFIGVLRDRGMHEAELMRLHRTCDIDALWTDLGPILDNLQDGEYAE